MTPTTSIGRLLIANRGEIARRIIRTAHDMGIFTVAVYADEDREAPYVGEAGAAVPLHGRSATETYLSVDKILDAARRTGCDAVHPGYGFLSESTALADACSRAGLVFVGPASDALRTMGLKNVAKSVAREAGLPTLPDALLGEGRDAWARAADTVGYPLLVKATAGGGGKGMRMVERPDDLAEAVTAAQREAGTSFGNTTVFLERYLARARHVEVQVFGDSHGNAIHLFERECSVQRRHQKVVEESPAPTMTAALRDRMTRASTGLVRQLGYIGAGTVEYLLDEDTPQGQEPMFYFLEMNTRLQVEHPVTELVTGLDLVRMQLEVAAGHRLGVAQESVRLCGHAVEARLCAEDPARDYRPTPGTVHRYHHPAAEHVRYEDALDSEGTVSAHFDPMIAKVIAWGASRQEAIARLARAVARVQVHGITTNREQVVAILRDEQFLAGLTWTGMLESRPHLAERTGVDPVVHLAAATIASVRSRTAASPFPDLDPGWRGLAHAPLSNQTWHSATSEISIEVGYRIRRTDGLSGVLSLVLDGVENTVEFQARGDDVLELLVDGVLHRCEVAGYADSSWWVNTTEEQSGWILEPRLGTDRHDGGPTGATLAVPGTVVLIDVACGDRVAAGQRLLVVEAMKMEHPLLADRNGVVKELRVRVGDVVSPPFVPVVVEEE